MRTAHRPTLDRSSGGFSEASREELHFGKYFRQAKHDAERGKSDLSARSGRLLQRPFPARLANKLFDARLFLTDKQVFPTARDLAIMFKLLSPVISFG